RQHEDVARREERPEIGLLAEEMHALDEPEVPDARRERRATLPVAGEKQRRIEALHGLHQDVEALVVDEAADTEDDRAIAVLGAHGRDRPLVGMQGRQVDSERAGATLAR